MRDLKLSRGTSLWRSLFFNFTQFVILENLLILDLALSGVKGLKVKLLSTTQLTDVN